MESLKDKSLKELIQLKDEVAEILSNFTIQINNGVDIDTPALRKYQAQKHAIIKAIDIFFDELHDGNKDGFVFIENVFERERAKLIKDEDGNPVMEVIKTGIAPFDDILFADTSNGIPLGTYMALVGESNAGKSDVTYMMIRGFLKNNEKVHLHSFELGTTELYNTLCEDQKHKLKADVENDYTKMLSVDFSKEMSDIIRMIRLRHYDGCRIFIIDSLTKILRKGVETEFNLNSMELQSLVNELGIIIIVLGQKSIGSIKDDSYIIYGSVMLMHHFTTIIFLDFENKKNRTTSERLVWMEKHRLSSKRGLITDYDATSHSLRYLRDSNGVKIELTEKESKAKAWAQGIASK